MELEFGWGPSEEERFRDAGGRLEPCLFLDLKRKAMATPHRQSDGGQAGMLERMELHG